MKILTLFMDIRNAIIKVNLTGSKTHLWQSRHPFDLMTPPSSFIHNVSDHVVNAFVMLIMIMGHGWRPDVGSSFIHDAKSIYMDCINPERVLKNHGEKIIFSIVYRHLYTHDQILFNEKLLNEYRIILKLDGIPICYNSVNY